MTFAGTWTHVVWSMARHTNSSTTALHNVYVDGMLKVTAASGSFPLKDTSLNYIGKSNRAADSLFVGNIDNLIIVPWALSHADAVYFYSTTDNLVSIFNVVFMLLLFFNPCFGSCLLKWIQCCTAMNCSVFFFIAPTLQTKCMPSEMPWKVRKHTAAAGSS